MDRAHRDLIQALFWLSSMPRSATRFSCWLRSPGTCTSPFYNSRLAYVPVFFCFQPKKQERPHKSDSLVWFCCKGHNPQYVPLLANRAIFTSKLVKFESKLKLHKKSNQSKQLTQEIGHNLHPSIQREVYFHSPFRLNNFIVAFPTSPQERQPKLRQRTDTRHYQVVSWTTTFSTRTWSSSSKYNYIQDPKGLPSSVHVGQSTGGYCTNPWG